MRMKKVSGRSPLTSGSIPLDYKQLSEDSGGAIFVADLKTRMLVDCNRKFASRYWNCTAAIVGLPPARFGHK
jgi:hypothetical protein